MYASYVALNLQSIDMEVNQSIELCKLDLPG
jgi:hypothetical protein